MRVFVATTLAPGLDLVGPLERAQSDVTVLRRVEDAAELLAVARSGTVDVLLLAGDLTPLTRGMLAELDSLARPVGLVAVSEVSADRSRARGLGVRTLRADADPLDLADALAAAARDAQTGRSHTTGIADGPGSDADDAEALPAGLTDDASAQPGNGAPAPAEDTPSRPAGDVPGAPREAATAPAGASRGGADGPDAAPIDHEPPAEAIPAAADGAAEGTPSDGSEVRGPAGGEAGAGTPEAVGSGADAGVRPDVAAEDTPRRPGRITAVWGPAGAPGRTTVAANLAAEFALHGQRVLLVDADTYGPSVGVLLGLTDESAGLARAVRDADRGRLDGAAVERAAVLVRAAGADLAVLTGLTRPERWPELRGPAVEEVLRRARDRYDEVVVDVGFCLEEDEELSFDIPAPQRNAATLAALRAADRILTVGTGDSVGLPRLMRGVEALTEAVPEGPAPVVVVNRVRAAASGTAPQSQITAVWRRFGPTAPIAAFLPADAAACDRALLGGQLLAEAAPTSPLRRALQDLVAPAPEACGAGRAGTGSRRSPLRRLGAAVAATLHPARGRAASEEAPASPAQGTSAPTGAQEGAAEPVRRDGAGGADGGAAGRG